MNDDDYKQIIEDMMAKYANKAYLKRLTEIANLKIDIIGQMKEERSETEILIDQLKALIADPAKLCKDCKFVDFKPSQPKQSLCKNVKAGTKIDLITGEILFPLCSSMKDRCYTKTTLGCGPEGKWFVLKD